MAQDVVTADALFERGVSDMEAKRYGTACPAIAASYRLDPRPGALFTLAECERLAGRVATAATLYKDYIEHFSRMTPAQQVAQLGREKHSMAQQAALAPLIPRLKLVLPAAAPEGTTVKRNGVVLLAPTLGVALPIDPGEHTITTQTPGGAEVEKRISIALGEEKVLILDVKNVTSSEAARGTTAIAPRLESTTPAPHPVVRLPDGAVDARLVVAFTAIGVGVTGFLLSAVTGALALNRKDTIEENCMGALCNAEGKATADTAQSFALASTIGFGVGAAGLGTGVVLLLTAPDPAKIKGASSNGTLRGVQLAARGAHIDIRGEW